MLHLLILVKLLPFNVLNIEAATFCSENYKLHGNRCFGIENIALNFSAAETECNKRLGGHLAAFRDGDELNFLKELEP